MSYYPPNQQPGGYPPYQQGHSPGPNPGWGQPPPQNYPPQQSQWNQPPPPMNSGQYPPPAQAGYGQGYPPGPQQGPPPGQYYPPPQQNYNQQYPPPPAPYGTGPTGQYGAPPGQQPYGAPPAPYSAPPQNQTFPPGQQPYGAPPPGQWNAPAPAQFGTMNATPPSLGYGQQTAQLNFDSETAALSKAIKGFGTDEKVLIRALCNKDPIQVNTLREQYNQRFQKDLVKDLEKDLSGYFEKTMVSIARGPLAADCWALYESMKGLGTKEAIIDDVLIARSNADIMAIKNEYQRLFNRSLEGDLRGDLSAGTEQMYMMIISARRNEDSIPVDAHQTEQTVTDLQKALGNIVTKDSSQTCQILLTKNDAQLRAISQSYSNRFHKDLDSVIKSKFSGHMEDALVLLLARARNRAASDAVQLEHSMAGIGTKDTLLVQRVVRAHWNRQHMAAVRTEYQQKYRKDLVKRIKGETSGDYERALVACVESI